MLTQVNSWEIETKYFISNFQNSEHELKKGDAGEMK